VLDGMGMKRILRASLERSCWKRQRRQANGLGLEVDRVGDVSIIVRLSWVKKTRVLFKNLIK